MSRATMTFMGYVSGIISPTQISKKPEKIFAVRSALGEDRRWRVCVTISETTQFPTNGIIADIRMIAKISTGDTCVKSKNPGSTPK